MQEIDYKLEGQNADRFRRNFADSPWIKVLTCSRDCSSKHTWPPAARALFLSLMHHTMRVKLSRSSSLCPLVPDFRLLRSGAGGAVGVHIPGRADDGVCARHQDQPGG